MSQNDLVGQGGNGRIPHTDCPAKRWPIGRPIKRNVKREYLSVGERPGLFVAFSLDDPLPSRF